jgi:preprotein translocase subunit SecF/SecD/SecF fusion protein
VGVLVRGLTFGIEFQGGTEIDFSNTGDITIEQLRGAFGETGEPDVSIQTTTTENEKGFMVRSDITDPTEAAGHAASVANKLGLGEESYTVTTIGPDWGSDVTRASLMAFGVAIVLIIAYVSIRYEFKMSITAIAALLHDLVVTLGVYAWTQTAITPNVVAALLTIMGYSLYDTVVEFNRTDENAKSLKDGIHRTYFQICNYSINEVIVRTINTTITTIVPVICMLLLGGATLKDFAFAMLVGELLGTYSSFAVASPLLAIWKTREKKWARLEQKYGEAAQLASVEEVSSKDDSKKGAGEKSSSEKDAE